MNKITQINLSCLQLKTFTEQNAKDYCLLNNINPDSIIELDLGGNELKDISGIKVFENLEYLDLSYNNKIKNISVIKYLTDLEHLNISDTKVKDISVLKYLNNIKSLNIKYLKLKSDQIQYINSLKKLETLWNYKGFK